ncbi:MAG: hypothetical protein IT463_05205 [Planctomycetes bacterium]|nr:hypothetical protein [Planctomycetota bacterium]
MSGSGSTTLSGVKPQNTSVRREGRGPAAFLGGSVPLHVVILALALLIWWIARNMVQVTRPLKDAATVRFQIEDGLQGQWRILPPESMPVGIDVSGPTREINEFAAELSSNRNRFGYRYVITAADLENARVNERHQVQLTIDMKRLEVDAEGGLPAELTVQPLGERLFQVTLERFVSRMATVDLTGIGGRLPGYEYSARTEAGFELEVFGPAGQLDAVTGPGGRAVLRVANVDVAQLLETKAKVEGKEVESILKQGLAVVNLQLVPVEGLQPRLRASGKIVAEAPVEISFTELQSYVPVSAEFPVGVVLPNWLLQKGARVQGLARTVPVEMKVLASQREAFVTANLRVQIDLSAVRESDVQIEGPADGGPGPRRLKLSNLYYSLEINANKLTHRFDNPNVTAERYLPVEVEIVWTE